MSHVIGTPGAPCPGPRRFPSGVRVVIPPAVPYPLGHPVRTVNGVLPDEHGDIRVSDATAMERGLMSAEDKAKLDGVEAGAEVNVVETVKVDGAALVPDEGRAVDIDLTGKADKATTLAGYGITDARIADGTITLGSNSITPLTQHQSLAAYVNGGSYDSNAKKILLKHDSTTVAEIDATAFVKDGMVSTVAISGGNLVITFNTDAGKAPVSIPLTDIFNPANYYNRTAADATFVSKSGDTMTGGLTVPNLTVGSREGNMGTGSVACGYHTTASGSYSSAHGWKTIANEAEAEAAGLFAKAGYSRSYVWSGILIDESSGPAQESEFYNAHGSGTWNIMPNSSRYDQTYGMFVGDERLPSHILAMLISGNATVPAFSETDSYKPGDHVLYDNNKTYEFQVYHAAGAWDDSHVKLCKLPVNPHFTTFRTDRDYARGEYVFRYGYLYKFRVDHPAGEWVSTDVIWMTPNNWLDQFKSEVIAAAQALDIAIQVVDALPETGVAKVLYFVRDNTRPTGDKHDEYMWVNNAWEKIGSTNIDLSNYVQTDDSRLSDARTPTAHKSSHATGGSDAIAPSDIGAAASSHTHAASDITSGLATVATSGSYNDLSGKPTNVSAFTNDAGYLTAHQDITGKADKVANATSGNLAALDANGNLADSNNTVQGTFGCGELVVSNGGYGRYVDIFVQGAVPDHCTIIVYNSDSYGHFHYIALPNCDGADKTSIFALEHEIAPAFDDAATYAEGALVYYNDALYRCTTAVTSAGAWTASTNWTAASVEDVLAALRTALAGKADASSLAAVATTGSYDDLSGKPTIPAAQVNADWNAASGVAQILNKPTLAAVATTGSYDDLSGKPTIPAAQIQSDWNQSDNTAKDYIKNKPTIPTVPTNVSAFNNDAGYLTAHQSWNDVKPESGVPASDLSAAVQTSLGKADTALQQHQDISGKANNAAIATVFSTSATYAVGDVVMYEGTRYKCTTAVAVAGAWAGSTNWTAETVQDVIGDVESALHTINYGAQS